MYSLQIINLPAVQSGILFVNRPIDMEFVIELISVEQESILFDRITKNDHKTIPINSATEKKKPKN